MENTIVSQIAALIAHLKVECIFSTTPVELDLTWDSDLTVDEVLALEPALIVNAAKSNKQLVFQVVRGEIRYLLTTDGRQDSESWEDETGTLRTVEDAVALSHEFLAADVPIGNLKTARITMRPAGRRPSWG